MENSFPREKPEDLVTRTRVETQSQSFDSDSSPNQREGEEGRPRSNQIEKNEEVLESKLKEEVKEVSMESKPAEDRTDSEKIPEGSQVGPNRLACSDRSSSPQRSMDEVSDHDLTDSEKDLLLAQNLERQVQEDKEKAQVELEQKRREDRELSNEATQGFLAGTEMQFFFGAVFNALLAEEPKPANPIRFVLEFGGYKIPTEEENRILREEIKNLEIQVAAKQKEVKRKQEYVDHLDKIYGELDASPETELKSDVSENAPSAQESDVLEGIKQNEGMIPMGVLEYSK